MARFQGAPINLLHVLLTLIVTVAIVACSLAFLPEALIDYGIMTAILFWTGYVVASQWSVPPLHRAINVSLATVFLSLMAFLLWPFDSPM